MANVPPAPPAADYRQLASVEDVIDTYPQLIRQLFLDLDLSVERLADVKQAYAAGDIPRACRRLLEYYRTAEHYERLRFKPREFTGQSLPEADRVVEDVFTLLSTESRQPTLADGRYDWTYRGPMNDRQWFQQIHRFNIPVELLGAWKRTGNPKYAAKIDRYLRDWATTNWITQEAWDDASAITPWHQLNTGLRAIEWARLFHSLQASDEYRDATRLMMLARVQGHADYIRTHHKRHHNFITMQMHGLASLGIGFSEFKQASEWITMAKDILTQEVSDQVYPDGAQKELTAAYHMLALRKFETVAEELAHVGLEMPDDYHATLEAMWNYIALVARPSGVIPANNDSSGHNISVALRRKADELNRDDWRYIATHGQQGSRPDDPPSRCVPWAGQFISRSDWREDAHWSFFDIGPAGVSHQHRDKLHVSLYAHGQTLLADTGRFAYQGVIAEKYRNTFAKHSRGHNVIFADGMGQEMGRLEVSQPLDSKSFMISPAFDCAVGGCDFFQNLEGHFEHTRNLLYIRSRGWIVIDRITTDRPRDITALWHFHPDCVVASDGSDVVAAAGQTEDKPHHAHLRITPIGDMQWKPRLVRGQDEPYPMGWFSPSYNVVVPTTSVEYHAHIEADATFAWTLWPGATSVGQVTGQLQQPSPHQVDIQVTPPDAKPIKAEVHMGNASATRLTT